MALDIPIQSPLTEAQAELTSKIGSMKSLLSLDIDLNFNIPKENQISTMEISNFQKIKSDLIPTMINQIYTIRNEISTMKNETITMKN